MQVKLLQVKIQQLTVNESCLDYPGSISLPAVLMKAASLRQFQLVHVNNRTNGNRIQTYAVANATSHLVTVNGAASKLFSEGDEIHVLAFAYLSEEEADTFLPTLVLTDEANRLLSVEPYTLAIFSKEP